MSRKRRKSTFGRPRRVKNRKNSVSGTAESEKTEKIDFWASPKSKKRKKQLVVGRRNAKNAKNRPDTGVNHQFLPKAARHPWMKARKRRKTFVIRG